MTRLLSLETGAAIPLDFFDDRALFGLLLAGERVDLLFEERRDFVVIDELAQHQEEGEMEFAAADRHGALRLRFHQAALQGFNAGDDVGRMVAKRRHVGMIPARPNKRPDVLDRVPMSSVMPFRATRWRLATWSRASLARFWSDRLTSRVLVQARR